jgi:hypothetical protein
MAACNTKIAKFADSDYKVNIYFRSLANAERDEIGAKLPYDQDKPAIGNPLANRLQTIIDDINNLEEKPDALFFTEANRSSLGRSWSSMAAEIEEKTGYTYKMCWSTNATAMSFGKALFVDQKRVFLRKGYQMYTTETSDIPSGDYFGNDVLIAHFSPVELVKNESGSVEPKIVIDRVVKCMFVNAPIQLDSRLKLSSWINTYSEKEGIDVVFGDFNTFPDWGGDDMLKLITAEGKLVDLTPKDTVMTFFSFHHDVVSHPIDTKSMFGPPNEIVHETEDTIYVRHASVLDRVFARPDIVATVATVVVHPLTDASDHSGVSIKITVPKN